MRMRYLSTLVALLPHVACLAGVPLPRAVLSYATPEDGRSHVILDALPGSAPTDTAYTLMASSDVAAVPQQPSGPTWDISVVPISQNGAGEPLFVCKSQFLKPQQYPARLFLVNDRWAIVVKPLGGTWITRILDEHGRVERDVALSDTMQRSPSFAAELCSDRIAVAYGRSVDLVDTRQGTCETRGLRGKDLRVSLKTIFRTPADPPDRLLTLTGEVPMPDNPTMPVGTTIIALDRTFGVIRSATYPGPPRAAAVTRFGMTSLVYLHGGAGNPLWMRIVDSELQSRADEKLGDWNNILGGVAAVRVAQTDRTAVLYPRGLAGEKIVYCVDIRDDKARRVTQYDMPTSGVVAHVAAGSNDELLWIALNCQGDVHPYSPYSGRVVFLRGRQLQSE